MNMMNINKKIIELIEKILPLKKIYARKPFFEFQINLQFVKKIFF